jgi:hypothetical protein
MRSVLVLAVLLAAAPAWSGDELIRFRQADGTLGLVDDEDKLPPGAVVLDRKPLARPEPSPAAPETDAMADEPAAAAPSGGGSFRRVPSTGGPTLIKPREEAALDPEEARRNAAACTLYHLDSDCTEDERNVAADWCRRGNDARDLYEQAEDELELAQEEFDRCDALSGAYYCTRLRLDAAVSAFAKEEAAVERLEDDCRKEDCLPGWTREGCEP